MTRYKEIISQHFFRRTARKKEHQLEQAQSRMKSSGAKLYLYKTERSPRGPYRWQVVREQI
jgi:hypothetical protein